MDKIIMKNIDAKDFTLKNLLADQKFTVDYFQREYKWDAENVDQLIQDLTNAFMDDWKDGHLLEDVAGYMHLKDIHPSREMTFVTAV